MMRPVSTQTLQRLPIYLRQLKVLEKEGAVNVSAKTIADTLGLGEIQVRKDLAAVSEGGKPKVGYLTEDLIRDIKSFLGYDNTKAAVLVGAGKLGRALLGYDGFRENGLNIVAAFDVESIAAECIAKGENIFPLSRLKELCARMNIRVGILTVPADCAQDICDLLVDAGVLAIWNFAPVHLRTPPEILVKSENMAASLAMLSQHLAEKLVD